MANFLVCFFKGASLKINFDELDILTFLVFLLEAADLSVSRNWSMKVG